MTRAPDEIQPLVLFDGTCALCHRSVRFILRHERDSALRFTPLDSPLGERARRDFNVPADTDAMVLLVEDRCWIGSEAALRLARHLKAPYRWAGVFRVLPRGLHQAVYAWIARHRKRWFGEEDSCALPAPELAERFPTS